MVVDSVDSLHLLFSDWLVSWLLYDWLVLLHTCNPGKKLSVRQVQRLVREHHTIPVDNNTFGLSLIPAEMLSTEKWISQVLDDIVHKYNATVLLLTLALCTKLSFALTHCVLSFAWVTSVQKKQPIREQPRNQTVGEQKKINSDWLSLRLPQRFLLPQ